MSLRLKNPSEVAVFESAQDGAISGFRFALAERKHEIGLSPQAAKHQAQVEMVHDLQGFGEKVEDIAEKLILEFRGGSR